MQTDLIILQRMRSSAMLKSQATVKQTKMTEFFESTYRASPKIVRQYVTRFLNHSIKRKVVVKIV